MKLTADIIVRIRWRWLHSERFDDWLEPHLPVRLFEWLINRKGDIADWLDKHVVERLCAHDRAERDHCGRPEHDVCAGCGKPMPFMAPTPTSRTSGQSPDVRLD